MRAPGGAPRRETGRGGPGARPDLFSGAGGEATLARTGEHRREHGGRGATGVEHLEIAAEGRVGGDPAIVDIVGARPEGARMVVANVGGARPVHIGPGRDDPVGLNLAAFAITGQM